MTKHTRTTSKALQELKEAIIELFEVILEPMRKHPQQVILWYMVATLVAVLTGTFEGFITVTRFLLFMLLLYLCLER